MVLGHILNSNKEFCKNIALIRVEFRDTGTLNLSN